MRRAWALAAAMLVGCGGGGVSSEPQGGVVEVTYGDAGQYAGLTYFGDGPTRIVLASWLRDFPDARYRQHILRHELWHAMTGIMGHPTDTMCVSCDNASPYAVPVLVRPCPAEAAEVRESPYAPITVHFGEGLSELEDAAAWWNYGVLEVVVVVKE